MKTHTSFLGGTFFLIALNASVFSPGHALGVVIDLGIYDGHQYMLDSGSYLSIADARLAAQANGAELVSITTAAENDFLISAISPHASGSLRTAFIGLSRENTSDPFVWDSGEAFAYDNWRPAGVGPSFPEPTGEEAGVFYVNDSSVPLGYWADTYSVGTEPFHAIYEVVPEPSTLAMAGLGLALLAYGLRRRDS